MFPAHFFIIQDAYLILARVDCPVRYHLSLKETLFIQIYSHPADPLANNEQRDRDREQTRTMTEKDLKRETRREDIFVCSVARSHR